jgi:hypothetical protein
MQVGDAGRVGDPVKWVFDTSARGPEEGERDGEVGEVEEEEDNRGRRGRS